jgi:hypothetical protein
MRNENKYPSKIQLLFIRLTPTNHVVFTHIDGASKSSPCLPLFSIPKAPSRLPAHSTLGVGSCRCCRRCPLRPYLNACVFTSIYMCYVDWNVHFNTCGLRWIHAHLNKALAITRSTPTRTPCHPTVLPRSASPGVHGGHHATVLGRWFKPPPWPRWPYAALLCSYTHATCRWFK